MKKKFTVVLTIDPEADPELVRELIEGNGSSLPGVGSLIYHGNQVIARIEKAEVYAKNSNLLEADKKDYWRAVAACLVEFHGKSQKEADSLAADMRKRMEENFYDDVGEDDGGSEDLIYHHEAFDMANDCAGVEVGITHEEYTERYLKKILGVVD